MTMALLPRDEWPELLRGEIRVHRGKHQYPAIKEIRVGICTQTKKVPKTWHLHIADGEKKRLCCRSKEVIEGAEVGIMAMVISGQTYYAERTRLARIFFQVQKELIERGEILGYYDVFPDRKLKFPEGRGPYWFAEVLTRMNLGQTNPVPSAPVATVTEPDQPRMTDADIANFLARFLGGGD